MAWAQTWKAIGKGLAAVAKTAAAGAVWASQHPEVIAGVATVAGHPEIGAAVAALEAAKKKAATEAPVVAAGEVVATAPPASAPAPVTASEAWAGYIIERYRFAPPQGMNRFPDATEIITDAEQIAKREAVAEGSGRRWLQRNLLERNSAGVPPELAA